MKTSIFSLVFALELCSTVACLPQASRTSSTSAPNAANTGRSAPPPTGQAPTDLSLSGSEGENDAALVGNCLTQRIDFTGAFIACLLLLLIDMQKMLTIFPRHAYSRPIKNL